MTEKGKGIYGLIGELLESPLRSARAIFVLLTTLTVFLVLLVNWMSGMGVEIPFLNLEGTDVESETLIGERFLDEGDIPYKEEDIEIISMHVMALDNLQFTAPEMDRLLEIAASQGIEKNEVLGLNTFHTLKKCRKSGFDISQPSFKRLESILEDKDGSLDRYFSTEKRKKAFLTPEYWQLHGQGPGAKIFPLGRQESIVVLGISGVEEEGGLVLGNTGGDLLAQAIRRSTKNLGIPINDGAILVLLFEKEGLKFKSGNFDWEITVENIVNPGSWREESDLVELRWAATPIKSQ